MQIYVHRNNQQLGPFTEAEVKAQLASGALSLQDYAWWQGQATWIPLAQSPFAGPVSPPLPGAMPAAPGLNLPNERTSNLALWSLICGCCSILCGPAFIPAIILGHMGLSETKRNPAIKGRGMAIAGTILGYAFFAFYVLVLIIFGVLMALGNQVKTTFKTISAQVQAAQDNSDSDQSTNSPDQSTNSAPSDSSTNSTPTVTP